MPKKYSVADRKRMLRRLEQGATDSELKGEFGIADNRTLTRQLKKAHEEETLRTVRTEIIKESVKEHLAEVRRLIKTWSSSIKAPSPPSWSRYPLSSAEQCEQNRLFESIGEHLPFPELWRTYHGFKAKWDGYLKLCEELHRQVVKEATEKWGLSLLETEEHRPGLTTAFSWETLDRAIKIAMGEPGARRPEYYAEPLGAQTPNLERLTCDARVILYSNEALGHANSHWSMITEWAHSEKMTSLVKLLGEIRDLEAKMHDILENVLLRRDYILHSCNLCPGEGKLAL